MRKKRREPADPLIDEVRERRERLVREHGGLRGWVEYLRQLQAQHPELVVSLGKAANANRSGKGLPTPAESAQGAPTPKRRRRKPGSAKGLITISDDFHKPLDKATLKTFFGPLFPR